MVTECHHVLDGGGRARYFVWRRVPACERSANAAANPSRFAKMLPWIKPHAQQRTRGLLRPIPKVQLQPPCNGPEGSTLECEQQEQVADSKVDRLADELRALGIQF